MSASLSDLYSLEEKARAIFPGNNNVKPKLRQQLQRLRDLGWLSFEGNARYKIISN
ncbi:hypothetical protein [Rhodocyclus purpureus]|uniref:hypothetical protein n=1 Tax=Rhodocyclus purpureus TaxID=1067 RepID=UPI00191185EE|nr:hypothetical protein [Rhodocyclus purpureus]